MHMGNMATIGQNAPGNFKHVIINNGAHDSVGGQPTDARNHDTFSFVKIAEGCGYKKVFKYCKRNFYSPRNENLDLLVSIKF